MKLPRRCSAGCRSARRADRHRHRLRRGDALAAVGHAPRRMCEGEYADTLQVQIAAHARHRAGAARASTATWCAAPPSTSARSSGPTASCAAGACRPASSAPPSPTRSAATTPTCSPTSTSPPGPRSPTPSTASTACPDGCKRVEDKLRIVRDERDDFEPGQIVAHARGRRSAAGRRDPQGEPEADRPALPHRQERGPAPGQRRRGARLPAGRDAGGVERQGREPLRPRPGAGLGPRRLRDRRAPRRGELGQPGAGRCRASRAISSWSACTTPATRATARSTSWSGSTSWSISCTRRSACRARCPPEDAPGAPAPAERARIKDALAAGTLPLFDFGGLIVRAEASRRRAALSRLRAAVPARRAARRR